MNYDTERVTYIVAERNKGKFTPKNKTVYEVFDDADHTRMYKVVIHSATEKSKGKAKISCLYNQTKYVVKKKKGGLFDSSEYITVIKNHRKITHLEHKAILKSIYSFNDWEVTGKLLSVDYHARDNDGNEIVSISTRHTHIDKRYTEYQYKISTRRNDGDMAVALLTALMGEI